MQGGGPRAYARRGGGGGGGKWRARWKKERRSQKRNERKKKETKRPAREATKRFVTPRIPAYTRATESYARIPKEDSPPPRRLRSLPFPPPAIFPFTFFIQRPLSRACSFSLVKSLSGRYHSRGEPVAWMSSGDILLFSFLVSLFFLFFFFFFVFLLDTKEFRPRSDERKLSSYLQYSWVNKSTHRVLDPVLRFQFSVQYIYIYIVKCRENRIERDQLGARDECETRIGIEIWPIYE